MTPLQRDIRKVLMANRDRSRPTQYQRKMMAFRFAEARFQGSIGVSIYKAIERCIEAMSHRYAPPCRALERAKRTGPRMTMLMPDVNQSPAF